MSLRYSSEYFAIDFYLLGHSIYKDKLDFSMLFLDGMYLARQGIAAWSKGWWHLLEHPISTKDVWLP